MFERAHHRDVALVLQALSPQVLAQHRCWFGGGTAMALRYGEYRESVDIDFLVADGPSYGQLRKLLDSPAGLAPLVREGLSLELARDVVADRYGIRTLVRGGASTIKFEIVHEGRIELDAPGTADAVCGIATLTPLDLAAEKLLANADRWRDDAVFSRDLIDLAMMQAPAALLRQARAKAERAYGYTDAAASVTKAIAMLRDRTHRLDECMRAMQIATVTPAQLWQRIRRLEKTFG
ncbi:nucleotidyl transferase AbiEii/AbiGii toxin family protein [Ramlibacter humi]|uniref:Nucleotidyl transferase AbiEii/AbiGii toxin family protein n=1 Tax=Ramlibacter humi TaxID=2530451 RepID=A0A4Z0CED7_9BURK|nr:nucleotidyl transferase AbiEii/AbiGii toxin family protein [Ramlibacter humi]TFZ08785.1 hypothetical protein EZ216_06495 [Ramlibacter humi]